MECKIDEWQENTVLPSQALIMRIMWMLGGVPVRVSVRASLVKPCEAVSLDLKTIPTPDDSTATCIYVHVRCSDYVTDCLSD